ncbi:DUF981 family protein [Arthrobacter sp. KNU-44]|uniref:DUF981 family protein n=1 Tax=Arthrobacter sp. KNU-44 TaxID=3450744 RepID=UPI003F432BEE
MLEQGITYNTTMAMVAGAIMLLALVFLRVVQQPGRKTIDGWAWMFAALGLFLAVTGTHMTLTWPLKQIPVPGVPCCAVDNLTFGEPAMFFGFLVFFGAIALLRAERTAVDRGGQLELVATVRPFLYAGAFGGIGLIMIAVAGLEFGMWHPPKEEPIAGMLAGSILEALYMAFAYAITGVAAITAPFAPENRVVAWVFAVSLFIAGMMWLFLSITVFYGHVGFFPH